MMQTTPILPALATLPLSTRNENPVTRPVVFVVDKDAAWRVTLGSLIRSAGLQVKLFSSAQKFLKEYLPGSPCCLVLGIGLSEPGGLDFQADWSKRISKFR